MAMDDFGSNSGSRAHGDVHALPADTLTTRTGVLTPISCRPSRHDVNATPSVNLPRQMSIRRAGSKPCGTVFPCCKVTRQDRASLSVNSAVSRPRLRREDRPINGVHPPEPGQENNSRIVDAGAIYLDHAGATLPSQVCLAFRTSRSVPSLDR